MKRSDYMTQQEILEENMEQVAEWSYSAKSAIAFIVVGLIGLEVIGLVFEFVLKIFGLW